MSEVRCSWASVDPIYIKYHDKEWGVPLYDDQKLFEFLILDGMQAGLSWLTILKKRNNYRKAFDNFNPEKIVKYNKIKIEKLIANNGIIRNKLKIQGVVCNAKAYLAVQEEGISFCNWIWQFVGGKPKTNRWKTLKGIPATTKESIAMSMELKKRGFKFVGPIICYAFMQATGMVNDHVINCFRFKEINNKYH